MSIVKNTCGVKVKFGPRSARFRHGHDRPATDIKPAGQISIVTARNHLYHCMGESPMDIIPLSKNHQKRIRQLHRKKYRQQEGAFIAEGLNALTAACKTTRYPTKAVILTHDVIDTLETQSHTFLIPADTPLYSCSRQVMESLSTEESPQGILLVCDGTPHPYNRLFDHPSTTLVYLDSISDPGNLGTIFRSALWFGIEQLILGPSCVDPFNTKVIRASAGALFAIEIYGPVAAERIDDFARQKGYRRIATVPRGGFPAEELGNNKRKSIIMLGQEAQGLSQELIDEADLHITIPGSGKIDSLNLSTAASIIFYEISRSSG